MVTKSILIVDDDQGILKSFKDILEPEGYRVDTVATGLKQSRSARLTRTIWRLLTSSYGMSREQTC